jgi:hypothetical protein
MRLFSKEKAKKDQESLLNTQGKVEAMLASEGWKIVERFLKKELNELYKGLLDVKPEKLKEAQNRVNLMSNIIIKIHSLAGLKWDWNEYRDMRYQIKDERTPVEKLHDEFLKVLEKGDTYGGDN